MKKSIPTTILLASNNVHKLLELRTLLQDSCFNILTANELKISSLPEVIEDGDSYEKNAIKKACAYSAYTNLPCISDDSGLEVDALSGEPGIYSARWSGVHGEEQSEANNKKLLAHLKDIPKEKRTAKFVSVIVLAYKNNVLIVARGECKGLIVDFPKGKNGFGYDPLFEIPVYKKTFAELGDIKNKISHRAKALEILKEKMLPLRNSNF